MLMLTMYAKAAWEEPGRAWMDQDEKTKTVFNEKFKISLGTGPIIFKF